ncbi:MAG: ParB/RepB/Spo0J family partition protein [Patescibacteria group bacterium]
MENQESKNIPLNCIKATSSQPRTNFNEEGIQELALSIQHDGVLQPIIVRPLKGQSQNYQVVVGSRRFRAAQHIGLKSIPAIVATLNDLQCYEVALIENLQREDLTIFEEAIALFNLMKTGGYEKIEDLAKRLGKSAVFVRDRVKILQLPEPVQRRIAKGELTLGQSSALLRLKDDDKRVEVASLIAEQHLTNDETQVLILNRANTLQKRLKISHSVSPVHFLGRIDALVAGLANAEWHDMGDQTRQNCVELCQSLSKELVALAKKLNEKKPAAQVHASTQSIRKDVCAAYKAVELIAYIEEAERRVRGLDLTTYSPDYYHSIISGARRLGKTLANRELDFQRTVKDL